MSTILMIVVAVAFLALVAAFGYASWNRARTRRLRRRFGPEYDRAVERHGGRAAAERELMSRHRRHRELELRELDPAQRERYREQWLTVQERFVDQPGAAVEQADRLVLVVMGERGYPTRDFDDRIEHLSVEHAGVLDHYRRGHDIGVRAGRREATTEELRQAMVHYHALFDDLLGALPGDRAAQSS
ncbi:hypothetical protein Acsp03_06090 [Actinomadura sp. NBRC 104412]|uniref:hypothetical protein n=1 Tax=Actinomadura sp. NBRC 104412 TaxID=3032203 RepID=UPI0024A4F813|nr:hypothetical protein [Actinomadura sp. NBRC 104412]GLZ03142.1 hypothetical protein Acsp03_06090 [Actinomadura sp. NBRC 104412]